MSENFKKDIDFEIEDVESEDDENMESLNTKWEREDELIEEISKILDENIDISFEKLCKRICKLIHDKYPYLYSEDINNKSKTFINILKYLESSMCSSDELREYLDSDDKYIRCAIAANSNCTADMLDELYNLDFDGDSHFAIALNPNCSDKTINSINEDESTLGRIGIALNLNCNERASERLQNVNSTYAKLLLKNPKCSLKVFESSAEISYYVPYVLINDSCPDYIKCYAIECCLNSKDINSIDFINMKIISGSLSQTVIDFLANSKLRSRLSVESNEYINANKTNSGINYNELFNGLFVAKDYPANTLDFSELSGRYDYSEHYEEYHGLVGNVRYIFNYFGNDGSKVFSRIRELGTNVVAFGEAPLSPASNIEKWAFNKLIEEGIAVKTDNTYRNVVDDYNHELYTFNEYDYNGYKMAISKKSIRRVEPVYWKLGFDSFTCISNLYAKRAPKVEHKMIPMYLSEDLKYVAPGPREKKESQQKLQLENNNN